MRRKCGYCIIHLERTISEDGTALESLHTLVDSRLAAKRIETESYLPDRFAVVEQAKVITSGMYPVLIVSPEVEEVAKVVEGEIK